MGFGPDGEIRTSHLVELSLDGRWSSSLRCAGRVENIIAHLQTQLGISHVVAGQR